ncbi:MAG: hypothetical protein A2840_02445 [Candidatus Buchananbacteria bacterium RIFCSPHIGHO2_01_FULL_47_11b]|uniref:DUF642 domain-containing protein n=1 Tax=Candidatus Buchananbacteria bacterium RIFCSPHIGHO2_01_FULL_47_11b TaxID=1797537 RepID=A0A1G1Y8K9_9BACT|nr:MAG: hypothetical protein A2840_02445 [Candidatus Buchananbacteria bacterium RIFCSPHIGHO2_01_FULL_47_11b]
MKAKPILVWLLAGALVFSAFPAMAAENLVVNGSFEAPVVTQASKWDAFAVGTAGLEWAAEWVGGSDTYQGHTRPEPALVELHKGIWTPYDGAQYTELDSDWTGPVNGYNGEPASVKISQTLATCAGGKYEIAYAFSPRPAHADNVLKVYWNGSEIISHSLSGVGKSNTSWNTNSFIVTATGSATTVAFAEGGAADGLGMLLDGVSVTQTNTCDVPPSGEIISPTDGEVVVGTLNLAATYADDDPGIVQWAVRKGTCAVGQGTVMGNVDGFSDEYSWDGSTFGASADVSEWEVGEYCFIFNPKEEADETDIRLTVEFSIAEPTKAWILDNSGVEGKGILTAPGLQKTFNPNSQAAENAGKKK